MSTAFWGVTKSPETTLVPLTRGGFTLGFPTPMKQSMDIRSYFEATRGTGVLATADRNGRVNVALYARPHMMDDGTLAFIMADRLSRKNVNENPHAAYLFQQEGTKREGVRLSLTKVRESSDPELIGQLRRRSHLPHEDSEKIETLRLVYFSVDEQRPLIGGGEDCSA